MTDTITHPRFTLHFGKILSDQYGGPAEVDRWLLDSTAPGWTRENSSRVNAHGVDTYLNCAHIVQAGYAPVRTEVPL